MLHVVEKHHAVAKGYDAIHVSTSGYMVVLNRTKLTVQKENPYEI